MTLKDLVRRYKFLGFGEEAAEAHAASEIILQKIASSGLADHVAIKGGILMYNLTKNARRATTDLDFDFIRYSADPDSLRLFVEKLDSVQDGISVEIDGPIKPLKHSDYKGERVFIALHDRSMKLKIKWDVGVHSYNGIAQRALIFSCQGTEEGVTLWANPNEQIFTEKILSLAKLGPVSTRYKDIYDLYYLVKNQLLDREKTAYILGLFLWSGNYPFSDKEEVYMRVEDALKDPAFAKDASHPDFDWIQAPYSCVIQTLLDFLFSL